MAIINTSSSELQTESWIGADFQELEFQVFDSVTQGPVDLTTFQEIRWVLFRYGDPDNPLLNLVGTVVATDPSKFNVYVNSEFTTDLGGSLYVQQPVLIDSQGKEFRPAQGQIHLVARGNGENSTYIQEEVD